MRELDRRIASLRLRLAEISAREEQLKALRQQFRVQLDKVMEFAVYGRGDLNAALSAAEEVDTRLIETERTLRHLVAIRSKGKEELDTLLLTRSIEAAKADLVELETRRQEVEEELRGLQLAEVPGAPTAIHLQEAGAPPTPHLAKRAELEAQHAHLESEIRRLHQTISDASDEAARNLSARTRQGSRE
jgi:cell division protein FtsB